MAGIQVTTEDGRLIGPFNSYLPHPEVATGLSEFKAAEATHTTLSERVREVVIRPRRSSGKLSRWNARSGAR